MKKYLLLSLFYIIAAPLSYGGVQAQTFFHRAAGAWQGTLEYLDYSKNERVVLDTLLTIEPAADGSSAKYTYTYDDVGRVIRSTETHRLDAAGPYFIDDDKYAFEETKDGFVLYGRAQDGNSEEPVRKTVTLAGDTLTILKETRTPYAFRHVYTFRRSNENIGPDRILLPAQMAQDLAILHKTLVAIHPGLYRYNTPSQLEAAFAAAAEKITGPLPEGDFFRLVAQITASIKCGHTFLNPLNQTKDIRSGLFARRNYLPFYFRLINKRMIVTGNLSRVKLSAGSEILKINGIPVSQIVDTLLTVVPADGVSTTAHRLNSLELASVEENRYQPFDIYFPLFFPVTDNIFNVEATDRVSKKTRKFQVPALTRTGRFAQTGRVPAYDDGWKFEIRGSSTGYLKIGNSITWRLKSIEPKKFLAEAFSRMRAADTRNLIIDLRGNGGGDTDVGYELARYLARKKLPAYLKGRRLVRNVSAQPEILEYLDTYSDALKAGVRDGLRASKYRKWGNGFFEILPSAELESYPHVVPYADRFAGKTYLISDASNASATFQFLEYAQDHKLGTIVGQETGGNRQGINGGNYFFLSLPNSKIEIDVPVYFQSPSKPQKDTGIVPDRIIAPLVDDIAAGVDTELNYVLGLIGK